VSNLLALCQLYLPHEGLVLVLQTIKIQATFKILFWRRNLDERVIGSNVLSPEPIAGWSPLAELIFGSPVLAMRYDRKTSLGKLTFVVRKEATRIKNEWLAVVYIETRVCVPEIAVD